MGWLSELLRPLKVAPGHRPWPRADSDHASWVRAGEALHDGHLALLGLWGDAGRVHLAVSDEPAGELGVLSFACVDGAFPSIGAHHPPAIRLERAIQDLYGLTAQGLPDGRPWLDHGRWGVRAPSGDASPAPIAAATDYPFLPVDGEGLHQIPVGPVHAGIIEPGHFRFTVNGETIVRLEARLGYVHKGVERLMAGATIDRAVQLAERVSGDSAVAYALAFARAVEAALGIEAPPRAHVLRGVMAELERLANHFGDVGAICNDAAFVLAHAHCAVLRERVLRTVDACFGHRLMRGAIVPGGVACELDAEGMALLRKQTREWRKRFARIADLYDETNSLQDRTVGAGVLSPQLARQFGAGGFVGRASGRRFDARAAAPYPPYDRVAPEVPVLHQGDVDARVRIRMLEIEQSLALIDRLVDALASGNVRADVSPAAGEGIALVEGFRGDVLVWVRLGEDGRISRCHLRDPSWFQWPLLEAAIENNIVGDFPLCNKSFNCSYSGCDL